MKRFISQFFLFMFIVSVFMVLLISGTLFILSSASFAIPEDKNILVLGDSHTECAIDDSIFSRSVNVSQNAIAYLYSYVKLRKFLDVNPHIDKVLLSFHGDSMAKASDRWIFDDVYLLEKLPKNLFLLHKDEILLFAKKPSFYSAILKIPVRCIITIPKYFLKRKLTYKDLPIGGYVRLDRDKLQKDIELQEGICDNQNEKGQYEYSQYQIDYLLKIVELCREKNVELILFDTPMYDSEKYGNKAVSLAFCDTYLSGTKYLDFSDFKMPEYGYGDIAHLNYKGAEIFSQYLEDNYEAIFENR